MIAAGDSLFGAERFDSARVIWSHALREADQRRDSTTRVRALLALARVSWQTDDFPAAHRYADSALAVIDRRGMRGDVSTANRLLGLVALGEGRNADAVTYLERALDAARREANASDEARAAGNLGLAHTYTGDYARARTAHREARRAGRALGDAELEGKGLANEAMIDIWEGDASAAIARLDTARALYRRARFEVGEAKALGQLATAYELTGEEHRSFSALDTAIAIARRLGMAGEELDDLRLVAGLHLRLGDTRRALEVYRDAETRMRSAGLTGDLASLLRGEAEANMRLGNLTRADQQLSEALTRHTASGEPDGRLDDLLLGAEIDQRAGRAPRAAERLREARAVASKLDTRGSRIAVALTEAHLADLAGDSPTVLRALAAVAPDLEAGDYGAEWMREALASRAYARTGQLDSAVATGRRAVAAVERLRGDLASEALRSSYIVDRVDVYGDLVMSLLRLGRTSEAFVVADAARGRELLRHLTASDAASKSLGTAADLVEGERLLRRIDALVQRLRATERGSPRERGTLVSGPSASIVQSLDAARTEYEALMVRAARTGTRAFAVLGMRAPSVAEIQAALAPDEALLEYMVTSGELVTFVVTRRDFRVLRHALDGRSLTQRVWLLRDLWGKGRGDWRDGLPAAHALYRTLVAPAEEAGALAGSRRLIVVPLGVLSQVPFAALVDSSGAFLVRRYEVVHLPSAGSLSATRGEDARSAGQPTRGGTAFAPFPNELPATVTEATFFRTSAPGWTARVGADATEGALRRALATDVVVHVASHGVVNVRNPIFSRLELARPARATLDDDGRLEAHEILGLAIRTPLVFLSGCETGVNQGWSDDPVRGTGDLTLAQAVLAAGAPNVVMTLWRIDDAGAADFAGRFYRQLGTESAARALADAQRAMAHDPRYANPYYWAGYTLSGRGELPVSQSRTISSVSPSSPVAGTVSFTRSRP